jgi:hypothetical protein
MQTLADIIAIKCDIELPIFDRQFGVQVPDIFDKMVTDRYSTGLHANKTGIPERIMVLYQLMRQPVQGEIEMI